MDVHASPVELPELQEFLGGSRFACSLVTVRVAEYPGYRGDARLFGDDHPPYMTPLTGTLLDLNGQPVIMSPLTQK
jgi:hypothetical protein